MTDLAQIHPKYPARLSCLILVQPMLVAVDISLAIAEVLPCANVIVAGGVDEAEAALATLDTLHVAFLGSPPESDLGRRLAASVRALGGRLVFIGDEAEDLGPGPDWTVLVRPFTTDCVFAALKDLPQVRAFPVIWRTRRTDAPVTVPGIQIPDVRGLAYLPDARLCLI